MTELPRSVGRKIAPGAWRPWVLGPERIKGAVVMCPECHRGMTVGGGKYGSMHTIDADGTVSPSLVCPYRCTWHVFVRLLGWKP